MKNLFPGYYRPTDEEFSELWGECLFVLDTNVLLNLYRYSPATRDELTGILRDLSERLWVPWQVALEYQRNRLDVINRQLTVRSQIAKNLESAKDDAIKKVKRALSPSPVHPFLSESDLVQKIEAFFSQLINDVKDCGQDHDALLADDHLRERVSSLLHGRIGPRYLCERLEEVYNDGKTRYARRIPPGYADAEEKDDAKRYGDLIIWFQMIDHAQRVKKPIVFVTDDSKEDWWRKEHEKIIGPRPELVEEMLSKAGVRFYMYRAPRFIERATKYLERQANQQAIEEARKVAEQRAKLEAGARAALGAIDLSKIAGFAAWQEDQLKIPEAFRRAVLDAVDWSKLGAMDLSRIAGFSAWQEHQLKLTQALEPLYRLSFPDLTKWAQAQEPLYRLSFPDLTKWARALEPSYRLSFPDVTKLGEAARGHTLVDAPPGEGENTAPSAPTPGSPGVLDPDAQEDVRTEGQAEPEEEGEQSLASDQDGPAPVEPGPPAANPPTS